MILLGEMRDLETISTALTAAETGHLVFATLHTQDAASTVDRVIDVFPAGQQGQIRTQLAGTLEGVVAQTLLPTADGQGRVAAIEVLCPTTPCGTSSARRRSSRSTRSCRPAASSGMQTMEQALAELVLRGILTEEVALARSSRPDSCSACSSGSRRQPAAADPAQGRGGLDHGLEEGDQAARTCCRSAEASLDGRARVGEERSRRSRSASRRSRARPKADGEQPKSSRAEQAEEPQAPSREEAEGRQADRHKKLVGLKIGASQLAAARVVNNGTAELIQVARQALDPGIIVGGELREPEALAEALKDFFKEQQAAEAGRSARHREQPHRRPHVRHRRHRRPQAARERDSLSRPGDVADSARRGRARLPDSRRDAWMTRVTGRARPARRRVPRPRRPLRRGLQEGGHQARRHRPRGVRAPARSRRRVRPMRVNAAIVVVAVGSDRSTLAVSNGETCEFTRVIEWGGHNLNVVHRPGSGPDADRGRADQALPVTARAGEVDGGLDPERAAKVRTAVAAELQSFARELVSSLQFYQGQPGSLGIGEVVLDRRHRPAARARRRARAHARREGPRRRSAFARQARQEGR